jgi:3-hydroxyacyl-CoA dehydrogenase
MELVEAIRGEKTSPETIALIKDLAQRLEKPAVVVNDSPGFVTKRVLLATTYRGHGATGEKERLQDGNRQENALR